VVGIPIDKRRFTGAVVADQQTSVRLVVVCCVQQLEMLT
jgi:hypothetical protein